MTKKQWDKIAAEIAPHLEAIRQVAADNGIDILIMDVHKGIKASAYYISHTDDKHYRINGDSGYYKSDCDFDLIGEYEIKKALTPGSN